VETDTKSQHYPHPTFEITNNASRKNIFSPHSCSLHQDKKTHAHESRRWVWKGEVKNSRSVSGTNASMQPWANISTCLSNSSVRRPCVSKNISRLVYAVWHHTETLQAHTECNIRVEVLASEKQGPRPCGTFPNFASNSSEGRAS
jgi:hypothetical protein